MRTVKIGGNEYQISFPYAAFCALQDATGIENIAEIFNKMSGGSNFKLIATMLWAGLLASDDTVTLQDAYKILDLANEGEIPVAVVTMYEEFAKSFEQKVKEKATNDAKNTISPASAKK